MANACIFCGSTTSKMSVEHTPPGWVGRVFDTDPTVHVELNRPDGPIIFDAPWTTQAVKVVCVPCNTTWMRKLEDKVIPFLRPMIKSGQQTPIRLNRATLLATWAVKTALVSEHLNPAQRIVPDSEYERFYTIKRPPVGYVVWLAYRKSLHDSTGRELLVTSRKEAINTAIPTTPEDGQKILEQAARGSCAFTIMFAMGHVVFAVFGHNFTAKFQVIEPRTKATQWIWPPQGRTTWPSSVTVEDVGGIEALQKALASKAQP